MVRLPFARPRNSRFTVARRSEQTTGFAAIQERTRTSAPTLGTTRSGTILSHARGNSRNWVIVTSFTCLQVALLGNSTLWPSVVGRVSISGIEVWEMGARSNKPGTNGAMAGPLKGCGSGRCMDGRREPNSDRRDESATADQRFVERLPSRAACSIDTAIVVDNLPIFSLQVTRQSPFGGNRCRNGESLWTILWPSIGHFQNDVILGREERV